MKLVAGALASDSSPLRPFTPLPSLSLPCPQLPTGLLHVPLKKDPVSRLLELCNFNGIRPEFTLLSDIATDSSFQMRVTLRGFFLSSANFPVNFFSKLVSCFRLGIRGKRENQETGQAKSCPRNAENNRQSKRVCFRRPGENLLGLGSEYIRGVSLFPFQLLTYRLLTFHICFFLLQGK